MKTKKQLILNTIVDLMSNFWYYDRKEDYDLPVGAIQQAVKDGDISYKEMLEEFTRRLMP